MKTNWDMISKKENLAWIYSVEVVSFKRLRMVKHSKIYVCKCVCVTGINRHGGLQLHDYAACVWRVMNEKQICMFVVLLNEQEIGKKKKSRLSEVLQWTGLVRIWGGRRLRRNCCKPGSKRNVMVCSSANTDVSAASRQGQSCINSSA